MNRPVKHENNCIRTIFSDLLNKKQGYETIQEKICRLPHLLDD
ncbi:hypothetical protein FM120_36790 [Sphingobacterium faecium PCAi_F2.5]|nr:hypothetical protein FM120_36790 [Sphingobacterium faecium PCAi_F2.5]